MDYGDAVLKWVGGGGQLDFLPLQFERAGIGRVDPGDDLHQRRLARAILTHERMDVTALQPKRHVVEREHAGEGLTDVRDLEQVFGPRSRTALPNYFRGRGTDSRHDVSSHSKPASLILSSDRPAFDPLAHADPEARREAARLRRSLNRRKAGE